MNYLIKTTDDEQPKLIISNFMAESLNLSYVKDSSIMFGFRAAEIKIIVDPNLESNEVIITKRILEKLNLPLDCLYNLAVKNNKIIIGPFIGIFMGEKESSLFNNIRLLNNYVKNYKEINGVIFGFTLDNINKENLTMKGLVYNYNKNTWESNTLPYPSMILKRRSLNQEWREYFSSLYPDNIFNYKPIDKWGIYERLIQFPETAILLAPTTVYKEIDDILGYLEKHKNIYIKPIAGNRGIGIFNVQMIESNIYIKTRENNNNVEWSFTNLVDFSNFVKKNLTENEYVIQKTLEINVGNRSIDFRIGLEKDQSGNWKNIMYVTRISGDNSIVSNVATSGGSVRLPLDALRNFYHMDITEAKEFEHKLVSIGLTIARKIDLTGLHFGKLALDLAIDKDKKIWLIEVNNINPNDAIMRKLEDEKTFYDIRLTNMLYSKKLAGFDISTNNNLVRFSKEVKVKSEINKTRYRLFISIPGKMLGFRKYIYKLGGEFNLVGIIKSQKNKKVVKLEIEGQNDILDDFVVNIMKGKYEARIKGIAQEEIPYTGTENTLKLEEVIKS